MIVLIRKHNINQDANYTKLGIMYSKGKNMSKVGRIPKKSEKRRNLIVAYLMGKTEIKSEIKTGKILRNENKIDIEGETEIESKYILELVEKILPDIKRKENKLTVLGRILNYDKEHGELLKKMTKTKIDEQGRVVPKKPITLITLNINAIKTELKTQSSNKKIHEQIDWFLEEPQHHYPSLKPQKLRPADFYYMEIQRFYLFKQFYDFSKELYNERGTSISFKGLFNSYLLHLMFAVGSNKRTTIIVSPLLLWKAFADTFDEDYLYVYGTFSMDWIDNFRQQMDRRSVDEQVEIFAKCNKYFASLIPSEGYIKTPQEISTVRITDGSLKFLHNLNEATKWSEIFK